MAPTLHFSLHAFPHFLHFLFPPDALASSRHVETHQATNLLELVQNHKYNK